MKVDIRQAKHEQEEDDLTKEEIFLIDQYGPDISPEEAKRMLDEDMWYEAQDMMEEIRKSRGEMEDDRILESTETDRIENWYDD